MRKKSNGKDLVDRGLAVYSGQDQLGWIVEGPPREFHTFDLAEKVVGSFNTLRAAMRAVPEVQ